MGDSPNGFDFCRGNGALRNTPQSKQPGFKLPFLSRITCQQGALSERTRDNSSLFSASIASAPGKACVGHCQRHLQARKFFGFGLPTLIQLAEEPDGGNVRAIGMAKRINTPTTKASVTSAADMAAPPFLVRPPRTARARYIRLINVNIAIGMPRRTTIKMRNLSTGLHVKPPLIWLSVFL